MVSREILLRAMDTIKENLSYSSVRKAERLYNNGNVHSVGYPQNSTAGVINAVVEGDHDIYRVEFAYNNEMNIWEYKCSCPTRRRYCSHILALLLYLVYRGSEEPRTQELEDNIRDYIRSYSHDRSNLPIRGIMFGLEIEFSGNSGTYGRRLNEFWNNNHIYIKHLLERGWKLKYDNSVDFEFVSPISDKESLLNDFFDFENLWEYWADNTNSEAGIHVHVSMDDVFAVNKKPREETYNFLKDLAIFLEENFIKDRTIRFFGRDYGSYCNSWKENTETRLKWVNFNNLRRDVSKTIEFRIFSSEFANKLPEVIEKSYWLALIFRKSLITWRKEGRKSFNEWLNGRKLLRIIFSSSEINTFFKVFFPDALEVKSVLKG